MDALRDRVSRRVVKLYIEKTKQYKDAIVVASNQESISIIAHPKVLDDVDFKRQETQLSVVLPNGIEIPIEEGDCAGRGDILCITCHNLPGVDCGFGNLVAIDFCGQDVQEHDKVYTYCDHHNNKLLTPGRVLLVEDETFDHNCAVSKEMEFGGVVVNEDAELVGMCDFYMEGYLTALKVSKIARIQSERS